MSARMRLVTRLLLGGLALAASFASIAGAVVGDSVPALVLKDQFGAGHSLDASVKRIYLSVDRKGDGLMKDLAALDQARLDAQGAVVIADISGAPGFVKAIIRSSLKDRRYAIWLDVSDATTVLPRNADQITIIDLGQRKIEAIRYVADTDALKRELGLP